MIRSTSKQTATPFVGGNHFDKYRSKNPIHLMLMQGFLTSARNLLGKIEYSSILEIGCGPGDLAAAIVPSTATYLGIDIDSREVETARIRYPNLSFAVGSAYELPVESKSIDLVIACEVLEHLEDPVKALAEIDRVAKEWVLVSVPREPLWRILNMMRGKYWRSMGNTPGHIQHFSRRAINQLVESRLKIVKISSPFPWTIVLGCPLLRSKKPTHRQDEKNAKQ